MGLFDKKECAICGKSVGMLGSRKVEDGTICSECTKKLSPFFSERKRSTVAEIQQQLNYREQNKQALMNFSPTRTFGENGTKIYLDERQRKFVVSRKTDYRAENADLIDIAQVTNVRYEVEEHRTEIYMNDSSGSRRSYNPPRYKEEYEFNIFINVNSPYFSEIHFELTSGMRRLDSRYTEEYRRYEQMANEIVMALGGSPMGGGMGYQQPMGGMGYQQQGYQPMNNMGYQQQGYQPMNNIGYQQQNGYQQPMQGGFQQQNGYQQPMQAAAMGYQQQGGYQQQPMQGGYQQPMQGGYQQQPQGGYQQQPIGGAWTCPNCGSQNTTNFCQNCGTPKV